jgi:hypothetical protein
MLLFVAARTKPFLEVGLYSDRRSVCKYVKAYLSQILGWGGGDNGHPHAGRQQMA